MLEKIKEICELIGGKINLSADIVMWIGLGVVALIFILIVVLIAVSIKKCKKKKVKKQQQIKEKQEKLQAEQEQTVKEESVQADVETEVKVEDAQTETQAEVEEKSESASVAPIATEPVVEKVEIVSEEKTEKKTTAKAKTSTKKVAQKPVETKPAKKLNGKWSVEIKRTGEYVSKLSASNGGVMLYSETYTTEEGARNGIATIIKGIENGNVILYQDKNANYYFKIKTAGNRLLCVGEIYKSKEQCLKAIETVKRIASGSTISSELVEGARYIEYTPADIDTSKKTLRGKWKVETTSEGKYVAKLFASNGQLMLSTEEVANKKTAENAVESVKKNAIDGNFIIDRDKSGRYYYKLRNAQKSVICIGEAYESLDSCVSAIESVRRFASTAVIAENK